MKTPQIARLKIALAKVKPAVFRRIEVPLAIRLDRLHLAIQAAMGWTNSHLYEFRAGDMGWGEPHPDYGSDGPLDASKACLGDVLGETGAKTLDYIYDFGDCWDHRIKIERIESAKPGIACSRPPVLVRPRMSADPGATPRSWPPSTTRNMSNMPITEGGTTTTSIRRPSIFPNVRRVSPRSPSCGRESVRASAETDPAT